jgi:FkbM family methyltransferase
MHRESMLTAIREIATRAGLAYGPERWERIFLARHVPKGLDVVELGTSTGSVGALVVRRMTPGARYVGLEIDNQLVPEASRRIGAVGGTKSWRVICGAIGVYPHERVGVYRPGPHYAGGATDGDEVRAYRLSEVLEEGGIRGQYALLMDIEGSECGVLAHDADALARCRVMVAELHDCSRGATTVNPNAMPLVRQLALIAELGFRFIEKPPNATSVYAFTR